MTTFFIIAKVGLPQRRRQVGHPGEPVSGSSGPSATRPKPARPIPIEWVETPGFAPAIAMAAPAKGGQ